jgi:hypothetical protein
VSVSAVTPTTKATAVDQPATAQVVLPTIGLPMTGQDSVRLAIQALSDDDFAPIVV